MSNTIAELFGLATPKVYKGKQNPDKCSNDNLLIGLELEIEHLPNGRDWYQDRAGGFWSVVEDGSLRPRGLAWEFISKPAMIGTALAELRIFFEKFQFNQNNYSDRTSVHVHTNVLDFTQEQIANIALVYPVFEQVLFRYVNHHKKQEEQGYCRDTNLYCIPWADCRLNRNFVESFFEEPKQFVNHRITRLASKWEKYTALNLIPIGEHGTVEWRHMHGTADMEKLTTWLDIIGSIMKFCKENDFQDIIKTIKILNDVSTYQQFFNAVLNGTLPYIEEYRAPMAEGVINSKYSLVNYEANKGKTKSPAPKVKVAARWADMAFDEAVALQDDFAVPGQVRPGPELAPMLADWARDWPNPNPAEWVEERDRILREGGEAHLENLVRRGLVTPPPLRNPAPGGARAIPAPMRPQDPPRRRR